MERRKRAIPALLIIICLCAAVPAQELKDHSQGLLDRKGVLDSVSQVTGQAYPNADLVQVDEFTLCEYRPDGTGATWSDNYTKVLTEKGRRQLQELSFSFLLPYNNLTVKLLEVIKPDATAVPVDVEKGSKVMIDRSQMSDNIYNPNSKILQVGVPDVQVGDVVHIITCRETMKRPMPGTWDDYQVFESGAPIKHGVYEVRAPKERPLQNIALKDPVAGTAKYDKQERDGQIIYRWEASDVPRFYAEPDMPPAYTVIQRLLVSTLPDWKAISVWYWGLCKPHLEATTPEMQELVGKLTQDLTDRQKKIEAIFRWVSQQVRYMGITIEEEAPDMEPHDVKFTFENRHGVCRDKAALLVAMLRLAGFEAYPVLINAGPKKDAEVPIAGFNHAIACVRNDDGSYELMDCTDENTRDLLPSYLCNCSYLVAQPQGETLQTSPIVPAEENMVLVETTGQIDADGNLTAQTELKFTGINDNAYRSLFARVKAAERQRYFEGVLKASLDTATLTGFDIQPADMQDTSKSLSIRIRFTANDVLTGSGNTVMMSVPHLATRVGVVNFIIGRTGLKKRRFPLETELACGVREKLSLQIDPAAGSFVSMPEFSPIEDPTISWRQKLDHQGNVLQGEGEFLIKVVEFDPPQYLQLKETLKQIEYNERKMPILARQIDTNSPAADIVVLDHRVDYTLADAHHWTERYHVRKKILTYKGKKDNAELKLDYNPVWEQVNLIKATVTTGDQVKEASKEEINLMDAGWVASAPRYPAGKTLVASLPAVEVGSVIEYDYERVKKDRPFFAVTHVFRGFDPITRATVTLTAPASLALRVLKDDNGIAVPDAEPGSPGGAIADSTERHGKTITRQWSVQEQTPVKQEDSLPPLYSFNPVLRITSGNWHSYAKEVLSVLRGAARGRTAVKERARQIVGQMKTEAEKVTAIRDFVAKNIRAAGPDCDDLPLDAVTAADRTLADGYGNMADRAVLLFAMLDAVGLHPEFILVNYGSEEQRLQQFEARYPSVSTFGGVLVRVRNGSDPVYLNDTNQYAILGTTPADGHLALSLARGATETVSVAQDRKNLRESEYRLTLTEQGDARIAVTRKNYGDSFGAQRQMFTELPPEERNRYYQELVAEISQAAVADSNLVTDFNSYPGIESFSVRAQKYGVRDGDFLYFELPRSLGHLFSLRSDTHENPFYQSRDFSFRVSTVVELPPDFGTVVLAPEPKEWRLPAGGGTIRVRVSKQEAAANGSVSLTFVHEVDLNPFILEAKAYPDLLEIEKQLTHAQARLVLVSRKKTE